MEKVLMYIKHLFFKVSQLTDIACLITTILLIVYWNTPQYQSNQLWIHSYGAYAGDFIFPGTHINDTSLKFNPVFCYHYSIIVYIDSSNNSFFERFGVYQLKGK